MTVKQVMCKIEEVDNAIDSLEKLEAWLLDEMGRPFDSDGICVLLKEYKEMLLDQRVERRCDNV